MNVLGISAFYHDSAAALVSDGSIVAAVQEERFTRKKFDASFPLRSIMYCLSQGKVKPADIDAVVFYDNPQKKIDRLVTTFTNAAPKGFSGFRPAAAAWIGGKINQRRLIERGLSALDPVVPWRKRIAFHEHHASHAASAFFPSPFESAAILTMDGVGEWATTTIGHGNGAQMQLVEELHFPHSLGLLYSAFTDYLGFRVNSDEYKVMGLAPYGEARFADTIFDRLIDLKSDGSFKLNMEYFNFDVGRTMINDAFCDLFGGQRRKKDDRLTQVHMDIAASVQAVTEDVVKLLALRALEVTAEHNLCLAGGVALNCVANGKLLGLPGLKSLWIQPAAGDAGGALGAALEHYFAQTGSRTPLPGDAMQGSLLGPEYSDQEIESVLRSQSLVYETHSSDVALCRKVAELIEQGRVVGWFQGRMEYGPRALGARSILGDARNGAMQRTLNLKVKFRESFRPFAPAVLEEMSPEWFDLPVASPYMMLVAPVHKAHRLKLDPILANIHGTDLLEVARSNIPAVTHVDYSSRVQTVGKTYNPRFRYLIEAFFERTGCPLLINTSFNVNDEPIVCSPDDAVRCFLSTGIDYLCIGSFLVARVDNQTLSANQFASHPERDPDNIYTVF